MNYSIPFWLHCLIVGTNCDFMFKRIFWLNENPADGINTESTGISKDRGKKPNCIRHIKMLSELEEKKKKPNDIDIILVNLKVAAGHCYGFMVRMRAIDWSVDLCLHTQYTSLLMSLFMWCRWMKIAFVQSIENCFEQWIVHWKYDHLFSKSQVIAKLSEHNKSEKQIQQLN